MDWMIDCAESLKMLQQDCWNSLKKLEQREKVLQDIVDCYSKWIGVERLCRVWVVDFPNDDDAMAKYLPSIGQLEMRKDLVMNGTVTIDGEENEYKFSANYVFYYLMHELKHAAQQQYLKNPDLCTNSEELMLLSVNQFTNDNNNSYFSREDRRGKVTYTGHLLYMLQPTEKYAWEFAEKQTEGFVAFMHDTFPHDLAFIEELEYSGFNRNAASASRFLASIDDPVQEINDILFTMNGVFVDNILNPYICDIIEETQEPHMYERIKYYQERNERIKAEREQEIQREQNEIIRKDDVSELFVDVYREQVDEPEHVNLETLDDKHCDEEIDLSGLDDTNSLKNINEINNAHKNSGPMQYGQQYNLDDLFQDISDRR